jgi:ProQ/FINO family
MHGPKFCAGFRGGLNEESIAAVEVLRSHWPAAFPQSPDLIRPLAKGVEVTIAERTGWSRRYTTSVLAVWKRQLAYAEAQLRFEHRYDLTGVVTKEPVGPHGRARARERTARA